MKRKNTDWRMRLTADQYHVLREKGTEMPGSSELLHDKRPGMYACAGCGARLFSSDVKFDSGTGWPSFTDALPGAVKVHEDTSHFMHRTEVTCAKCGGHLGHMFDDGPKGKPRYCINGCSLDFKKK